MDPDTRNQIPDSARRGIATVLAVLAVGAVWAVTQLYGLGLTPFHTRGEPREAVVVQDLVARGDWILPRRNAVALPRKPPLFYWLGGAAAQARGAVDETAVRLPSAIQSGAAALLLAAAVAASAGPTAAAASGVTLLTSFEWLRAATAARVDMTLAFGLTLVFVGLLLLARRERTVWRWLVYVGAAWATLAKGAPGLAIPVLQLLFMCAAERSLAPLRRLRPLVALAVVLVSAGAWYGAATWRAGRPFVDIVLSENLTRLVGGQRFALGHEHSLGYLFGALAAGLLPWTLLLPAVAVWLWRERATLTRTDARLIALLWIVAVVLPHAFAASKRGVYLLPLYPAVALLIGAWAAGLQRGATVPGLTGTLAPVAWLIAALLGLLAIAAGAERLGVPLLQSVGFLLDPRAATDLRVVAAHAAAEGTLAALFAAGAATAVAAACAASSRQWMPAFAALAACIVLVIGAVRWSILPAIGRDQTRAPLAASLRLVSDGEVATSPSIDYGLLYYWGEPLPVYRAGRDGEPPRYLVVPAAEWARMTPHQRRDWRRVPGVRAERGDPLVILQRAAP